MLKRLVFALTAFVLLLIVAETTARLIESGAARRAQESTDMSGWQEKFFGSIFDWHEPDPYLLWRFKPNLDNQYIQTNSEHTIGPEVNTTKRPIEFRVLLLGDSSPVGLGLESYLLAFGERLRLRLQEWYGGNRDVQLINAAVAGYSSEQIVCYLDRYGWRFAPDLVILYCGNNDASISGFSHDRELMQHQRWRRLRALMSRLAIYRVLRAALASDRQPAVADASQLKVRVTPDQFEENLRTIARQCHRRNCPLTIVKPPVPLLWPAGLQFKPFSHLTGSDGQLVLPPALAAGLDQPIRYCLDRDRLPDRFEKVDKFTRSVYHSAYWDSLTPDEAVEFYRRKLVEDPQSPILLNNLGVACWERGDYPEANRYLRAARSEHSHEAQDRPNQAIFSLGSVFLFNIGVNLLSAAAAAGDSSAIDTAFAYLDSALQADFLSLRVKRAYLDRIDKVAGAFDNVTVIDGQALFARNGGEKLFIDHCHPTAKGHQLLADDLCAAITGDKVGDR